MSNPCDTCAHLEYDEEFDEYFCAVDMDEDEYYRFINDHSAICPHYRNGDEYAVVRHQI